MAILTIVSPVKVAICNESKHLLQETDVPPHAFAKLGLGLSGPYQTALSGNRYIVAFVDLYSGFPEAFVIPYQSACTIAYLVIEELFCRYGSV